ncbi:MAG: ATP-binding protein [Lachnospiraceae bacterium]|nr:ATP-binding protein [Lachnospiraceae bacterium]
MGLYLNPGNEAFRQICKGVYVDKTDLIDYVNGTVETPAKMTCFSRPRRFGKSFAAKMLCAYYDKSCDSKNLFKDLKISKMDSFGEYLNKYDVIYLDITRFISRTKSLGTDVVADIQSVVIEELRKAFPEYVCEDEIYLPDALYGISQETGNKFIVIIDEWDALFREEKEDDDLQNKYVQLLRGLFKGGTATDQTIAAAYMTGILPIKKYGTESALTDFQEFTMTSPAKLAQYVGFTETEVKKLCMKYRMDFNSMQTWYDGYSFSRMQHLYNPNSVINAMRNEEIQNYWTKTESFESLRNYIEENFDGLRDAVVMMLGGQSVEIDISTFQNDIISYRSRDDVLTLLIHLGYLAYDQALQTVYIPNREVSEVFQSATKGVIWEPVTRAIRQSEKLLAATISGDRDQVADSLDLIHEECTSVLQYNDENSLACAIYIAYYTARNYYMIIRELPAGKGFADYAFIPQKGIDKPPMIVELKYDKDADSAITQIRERRYGGRLKECFGSLMLVGINYDKNTKKHSCLIEKA